MTEGQRGRQADSAGSAAAAQPTTASSAWVITYLWVWSDSVGFGGGQTQTPSIKLASRGQQMGHSTPPLRSWPPLNMPTLPHAPARCRPPPSLCRVRPQCVVEGHDHHRIGVGRGVKQNPFWEKGYVCLLISLFCFGVILQKKNSFPLFKNSLKSLVSFVWRFRPETRRFPPADLGRPPRP